MITNEQVEAALKAWYDAGDAGNFASMFAALKAADLASVARIAKLKAALKPFADAAVDIDDDEYGHIWERAVAMNIDCDDLRAAHAALGEKSEDREG
jgi:hypothetical protein